jgi:hypothetical protein
LLLRSGLANFAQAVLELIILLPVLWSSWDCRCVQPCLAQFLLF